jgi:hypothetical protein
MGDDYKNKAHRIPGVTCKHATDRALLCVILGEEHWVPKSQVHDDSEVFNDSNSCEGTLVVTKWFAEKAGFAEADEDEDDPDAHSVFDVHN